jgi:hypothetical protein
MNEMLTTLWILMRIVKLRQTLKEVLIDFW